MARGLATRLKAVAPIGAHVITIAAWISTSAIPRELAIRIDALSLSLIGGDHGVSGLVNLYSLGAIWRRPAPRRASRLPFSVYVRDAVAGRGRTISSSSSSALGRRWAGVLSAIGFWYTKKAPTTPSIQGYRDQPCRDFGLALGSWLCYSSSDRSSFEPVLSAVAKTPWWTPMPSLRRPGAGSRHRIHRAARLRARN